MIQKIKLDMKGMQYVAIAYILMLVEPIVPMLFGSAESDNTLSTIMNIATTVISILTFVFIVIGLNNLSDYSDFFRKSRNFYLINIAIAVGYGILLVVLLLIWFGGSVPDIIDGKLPPIATPIIVLLILTVGVVVASTVIEILYVRNLCFGGQELSIAAGIPELGKKFHSLEKLFRIGTIVSVSLIGASIIGAVVMVAMNIDSFNEIGGMEDVEALNSLVNTVIVLLLIILAAAILSFVIKIIMTVRLWNGYKYLNGREVVVKKENMKYCLLAPNTSVETEVQADNMTENTTVKQEPKETKENNSFNEEMESNTVSGDTAMSKSAEPKEEMQKETVGEDVPAADKKDASLEKDEDEASLSNQD